MSDSHAHDGLIIVNVFSVAQNAGSDGRYRDAQFLKRGLMPMDLLLARVPVFIDDEQYEWVETTYELTHREVMLYVKRDESLEIVRGAAKAQVPDIARYSASAH